jgi:flagellar M-ring protein FliF
MNPVVPGISTFEGMSGLPLVRQVGLLIGLAFSIALGIGIFTWSRTPDYRVLYSGNPGIEILEKAGPFGNSEFMEGARYQHALEGELARSIQTINSIRTARVHLALPKNSAFLRDRVASSASVLVSLYPGHVLNTSQVRAIMNMVAAGIPGLEHNRVTIVDQEGQLLSSGKHDGEFGMDGEQFEYARRLEEIYISRIENLLTPIIGPSGVRAQVVIEMDHTMTEQAEEYYDPDRTILRSEQVHEERKQVGRTNPASGVPGALSNQEPDITTTTDIIAEATGDEASDAEALTVMPADESVRATRNYEISKTVSHTRIAPGRIVRLTAAVVIDHKQVIGDDGSISRIALEEGEIERINTLIKEAVGYSEARGDSVHITNTSFINFPEPEPLPEPPLLEQAWIWSAAKMTLSAIGILLLLFGVLRPVMRSLAIHPDHTNLVLQSQRQDDGQVVSVQRPRMSYEEELSAAKLIVAQDPKRVAQVVKNWVASDA